jgi:hypothetical protein
MAIYHLNASIVKRSLGHSATAAAAYRSAAKVLDERTGEVHDYRQRDGVVHSEIFTPDDAPEWAKDRERLWNEVELGEIRKDAQLCRIFDIALPTELTADERRELVREYAGEFTRRGMIVDTSIHEPHRGRQGRTSDNPHVHLAATMREIGAEGFGGKNRDWNRPELLEELRERWAHHANLALERAGHGARIDHRTLEAQGVERTATIHLGKEATALEHRGIATERGDHNRRVLAEVIDLAEARAERQRLEKRLFEVDREESAVKAQLIDLPAEREKRAGEAARGLSAPPSAEVHSPPLPVEGFSPQQPASDPYAEAVRYQDTYLTARSKAVQQHFWKPQERAEDFNKAESERIGKELAEVRKERERIEATWFKRGLGKIEETERTVEAAKREIDRQSVALRRARNRSQGIELISSLL